MRLTISCPNCGSNDIDFNNDGPELWQCQECEHMFDLKDEDKQEEEYRASLTPEQLEQYDSRIWS